MEVGLQIFKSEEFGEIRTLGDWENPKFCLPDVCRALDLRVDNVVKSLKGDPYTAGGISLHPITDGLGRTQLVNFVDEPCLYRVIFTSRKANALKFQDWIFRVVIPSIRKTGAYAATPKAAIELFVKHAIQDLELTAEDEKFLDIELPVLTLKVRATIQKDFEAYKKSPHIITDMLEELPGEIWKDIKEGYEGRYQVSTKGRVRSLKNGKVTILKLISGPRGYLYVCLYKNCKSRNWRINRLVAEAFIPNPLNLPVVHHRNNNHADNDVTNLEWVTDEENRKRAYDDGLFPVGTDNAQAKLTEADVIYIRTHYIPYHKEFGVCALAKKFGVNRITIRYVIQRKTWKHVA